MRQHEAAIRFAPNVTAINLPSFAISSPSEYDKSQESWSVARRSLAGR